VSYNGVEAPLGLKEVRRQVIEKLNQNQVQHETNRSGNIDEKNYLVTGKISVAEVVELINATKGSQYTTSKHHAVNTIEVHILKPVKAGVEWYIKCYVIEPDVWFISVHP
jgi:hypothetical protein